MLKEKVMMIFIIQFNSYLGIFISKLYSPEANYKFSMREKKETTKHKIRNSAICMIMHNDDDFIPLFKFLPTENGLQ
jgi:hypothetical protein